MNETRGEAEMSELLAPLGASAEVVEEAEATLSAVTAPAPAAVTHEPVLITEEQVRFATAAAVPLPPVKTRGWVSRVVGAFVSAASATSKTDDVPKRRHYPKHYSFIEDARMSREMYRL